MVKDALTVIPDEVTVFEPQSDVINSPDADGVMDPVARDETDEVATAPFWVSNTPEVVRVPEATSTRQEIYSPVH
jgi:hypothetical protein